ncbi:hypothetical protein HYU40_02550 [Candidatus Woesearchaeota archaeon]|nr:hypothetical protein [Candidatus Woesearchaeota archaeon]
MLDYLSFAFLALVLGFKHSYDADHLIAVSSLLRKSASLKLSVKLGMSWAFGHMLTATIVTTLLYFFRESLLRSWLANFDKVVGVMLVVLGLWSLKDAFFQHSHRHRHGEMAHSHTHIHGREEDGRHAHRHIFGIGVIHGLASNDELLLLFTASLGVTTLGGILAGTAIFSLGVVLGMVLFALFFSFPIIRLRGDFFHRAISLVAGSLGVLYGVLMLLSVV